MSRSHDLLNLTLNGEKYDKNEHPCNLENLVLKELETDLNEYKINYIIAHNYKFDKNVLLSEIYRNNNNNSLYEKIENIDSICTMELGMKFYNKTKSLKLIDLYNNLFEKNMRQYHRASKDVDLCILCYFDLNVKQLIFELNPASNLCIHLPSDKNQQRLY